VFNVCASVAAADPLPTLPRKRGRESEIVLAARLRARAMPSYSHERPPPTHDPEKCSCGFRKTDHAQKKGGGAPIGASTGKPHCRRVCPIRANFICRAARTLSSALAFRRSTAALRRGFTLDPARAALPGTTGCKREDPLRHQCSEHLAVRSRAGRADAQAARARGHEPRPREPHLLRLRDRLEKRPSHEQDSPYVTKVGTNVKSMVS